MLAGVWEVQQHAVKKHTPSEKTEDSLLYARLADAAFLCLAHNQMGFLGFLDERQAGLSQSFAAKNGLAHTRLWGGYPQAERCFFGVFPDFLDPLPEYFPIQALTFTFRVQDTLSHRDFLGALLSHGVRRDAIGDILTEPGRAVVFVKEEIAGYLLSQVEKIGRVGVRAGEGLKGPLPPPGKLLEISAVVPSLRLDCVAAVCTRLSREKTGAMIREGLVLLNHQTVTTPSKMLSGGDKLSIRGKGRFLLESVGTATKKGRFHIGIKTYI